MAKLDMPGPKVKTKPWRPPMLTFDLRAAYNAAAGRMMTVTLRNGVASYG